jgi:hypothetical protein
MILSYLDAKSLCYAEHVCKEWLRVISEGMLWKKLIERIVLTDTLWKGLSEQRGWSKFLFRNNMNGEHMPHSFYRSLYPKILKDIKVNFSIRHLLGTFTGNSVKFRKILPDLWHPRPVRRCLRLKIFYAFFTRKDPSFFLVIEHWT